MPHGRDILGNAGKSLADIYDVEGSVVHVDELEASVVTTFHELGATIASERMGSSIIGLTATGLGQNADILAFPGGGTATDTPFPGITRVLSVFVYASAQRINDVSVNTYDPDSGREMPLFMWEAATDDIFTARILAPGGAGGYKVLRPKAFYPHLPGFMFGPGQRAQVPTLAMRGTTSGFGAGTVDLYAIAQVVTADVTGTGTGAPSNVGLPIPSW